jgi:O-antigen/teichoic acid export membrane protein
VLPWIVAEADGRRDEPTIRRALSNALGAAVLISCVYALAAAGAWAGFPGLLGLSAADRDAIAGPLLIVAVSSVLSMPLVVCQATLAGMQDVAFSGIAAVVRIGLNAALTIGLLLAGYGLYAVALGTALPAVAVGLASVARLGVRFPALLREWPRPSVAGVRWLVGSAVGAWLGAFGWKLLSMSSGLVLTAVGRPELVPLYSCTARLSTVVVQMGWIIPDSGLIGLAQLFGEGRAERLREVTRAMLQLHLIIAGGGVTLLLAVNPAFVTWWVTGALYGGDTLNVLLAAGVVMASITHALMTIASVLGRRLEVGAATVVNGVLHVIVAWVLARAFGVVGLAAAAIVAAGATALPVGLRMTAERTGTREAEFAAAVARWFARAWPTAVFALVVGWLVPRGAVWLAVIAWVPIAAVYLWTMRPMYHELPIDPKFRAMLERVRLVRAPETVSVPELSL